MHCMNSELNTIIAPHHTTGGAGASPRIRSDEITMQSFVTYACMHCIHSSTIIATQHTTPQGGGPSPQRSDELTLRKLRSVYIVSAASSTSSSHHTTPQGVRGDPSHRGGAEKHPDPSHLPWGELAGEPRIIYLHMSY